MKQHQLFILSLFLFFLSPTIFAQQTVKIYGYVKDFDNKPMELVNVYDTITKTGSITNDKGYYELYLSNTNPVTIQYSLLGHERFVRTLGKGFEAQQLDAVLYPMFEMLGDVDVVALERQTSFLEKINTRDTRLMTGGSNSIESLLITLQGVSSNNELSSQYSVRGGSYDENLVYVNGVEVYRPLLIRSGQQEGLSFINPDMVGAVNFSAGGFDAQYGDKMSSVLDIQYKKPPKGVEASIGISLLGASAYIGQAGDKFSQIHGIRYKNVTYQLGALDTKGEYKPNYIDYQTYLTYQFTPKWELSFLGNYARNSFVFKPRERETTFGGGMASAYSFMVYFDGQEKDIFSTYFGSLNLSYKPQDNLKFSLITSCFNTDEEETYDITGEYYLDEITVDPGTGKKLDSESLGVGSYHEHARNRLSATVLNITTAGEYKKRSNLLKWGVSYQREYINDRVNEWELRDSSGYSLPYNENQVNLYYSLRGNFNHIANRFMLYVQDTYKFRIQEDILALTAGVRAQYYDFNGEWTVSPRLSMSYMPKWEHEFVFRLATGLYTQPPFYKELKVDNEGILSLSKNIKSQKSVHVVGGFDYFFKLGVRPFKFTVEGYYKYLYDLIPYNVDNVQITYSGANNAIGYATGIDMKLFGEFIKGTDSWISLSLMQTREDLKDDFYIDSEGNRVEPGYLPRPTDQLFNISIFFQDYFPRYPKNKFNIKMIFAGGFPVGPPGGERYEAVYRMPEYIRVDLGYSRQLIGGTYKKPPKRPIKGIKSLWIQAEVLNLLGIRNVNSYYWITGINKRQYAVPNYLTRTQINVKLLMDF